MAPHGLCSLMDCAAWWTVQLRHSGSSSAFSTVASEVVVGNHRPELLVVQRRGVADGSDLAGAAYAVEAHVRVVGLAVVLEPMVPVVAPLATRPQARWQPQAALLLRAAAVARAAVKVVRRVARVLRNTAIVEHALACARDLDVETVVPVDVVAYVGHLHDHGLVDQERVRAAPAAPARLCVVPPVDELKLVALTAVGVAGKSGLATDGRRREAKG
mmetsp:Transcript_38655/g.104684  ORF Transcript_38655/g.104684 Transcript_38655/m.104684 type:complete len:216 (+) Transcript_38655:214-861(+)